MRLVIVGGVAAGMSAATRARRMDESAEIVVLEKGGYVSFANCGMPYYLAGRIRTADKLLVTTAAQVGKRFRIDARTGHEVLAIRRAEKVVRVREIATQREYDLGYDKLVLAPGGVPVIPPIEHIRSANVLLLRSMEDTFAIEQFLATKQPKRIAIVGAGFIGLEMAEAMRERGLEVAVIEKAAMPLPQLDADMAAPLVATMQKHGIETHVGTGLQSLQARDGQVTAVVLENGTVVPADMVLLSIGVRPNVQLAKDAGLTIGATGGIAVDEFQRTSDADVYAAGDAAELVHGVTGRITRIPLAGPANRQGRTAGEHAVTGAAPKPGKALGTAILQLFETTAAMTGLGEVAARAAGFDVGTAVVVPNHHASYYPGAESMRLKLVYDRATRRVLGASGVGGAGIDKRMDVIATVLHFGGTIDDLTALDLAYAPQFGSAKDPVHMAGFVAQNQQDGVSSGCSLAEINGSTLLDVRTPEEFAAGALPGAVNIPVDDLRGRLGELDRDADIVTYCKVGQRGYVAERILRQHGFAKVRNLKGGYTLASEQPK
jgi:NADPH-dependent 2,4-dienoyl-CoA reductase/sulfur reductase-like enzyme/rhodanese-related sulfurtransferase